MKKNAEQKESLWCRAEQPDLTASCRGCLCAVEVLFSLQVKIYSVQGCTESKSPKWTDLHSVSCLPPESLFSSGRAERNSHTQCCTCVYYLTTVKPEYTWISHFSRLYRKSYSFVSYADPKTSQCHSGLCARKTLFMSQYCTLRLSAQSTYSCSVGRRLLLRCSICSSVSL